ncbi:MAG: class I SAM-dependent methyltransferase [Limisphaerales bacterium]
MNLEQTIVREIEKTGFISFARFMELALYAPDLGYYETRERVGRGGDFYTSVSVGNLFGHLLAMQFAHWMVQIGKDAVPMLVETGANDGQLAQDILQSLSDHSPELSAHVQYIIVEPSQKRRGWQLETLKGYSNVRWVGDLREIDSVRGVIFSNELLDAMPFHRLQWNRQTMSWDELNVAFDGNSFIWKVEPCSLPAGLLPFVPVDLGKILPDGFQTEVSPAAVDWWRRAAAKLEHGKLVAFDYGLEAEEFFTPERSKGTARGYTRHKMVEDLLASPGEQDITCHVNFSAIGKAGNSSGLKTEFMGTQAKFVAGILEQQLRKGGNIDHWDRKQVAQLQTLTHPAHLGTKFKVMVQSR